MNKTHTLNSSIDKGPLLYTTKRAYARFTAERDRDFINLCRKVIAASDEPLTDRELVRRVIHSVAPAYYVDFDYALHIVPRIGRMDRKEAARHAHGRWLEIYDRAMAAVQEGYAATLTAAIAFVLSKGHASRFFISEGTALNILREPDNRIRNRMRL